MTLDEVIAAVHQVRDRFPEPPVSALAMHPSTWAKLAAKIERANDQPRFRGSAVLLNPAVPLDVVIPLDGSGRPIPKPLRRYPSGVRTPSSRRQAMRVGAARGRDLARLHLARAAHLGEVNRILKRLRDPQTAAVIFDGYYDHLSAKRWRSVMVRAFRRTAIAIIRSGHQVSEVPK